MLQWHLDDYDTLSVDNSSGTRTLLSFDQSNVTVGESGAALLPGFSMFAGIPSGGNVRASIVAEEVAALRIANPLKEQNTEDGFAVAEGEWISEPLYSSFREYRAAQVIVSPFRNLGNGRVQVLRKARITLEFPSSEHSGRRWEPTSDYERMVRRLLVNFETAQGWVGANRVLSKTAARQEFPLTGSKVYRFSVGDGCEDLNEATTRKNGIVKIRGSRLISLFGEGVEFSSVALYASVKGELDPAVPSRGGIPLGVSQVPTLRFDSDKDGTVDPEDYILAYTSEVSDWTYNQYSKLFTFSLNRYDDYRTYWLTVDNMSESMEMTSFAQPEGAGVATEYFENNVYLREPRILAYRSREGGTNWAWRKFDKSRSDTSIYLDLPGLEKEFSGSVLLERSYSTYKTGVSAALGTEELCSNCRDSWSTISDWNSNELQINYFDSSSGGNGHYELSGIHVRYRRRLQINPDVEKLEVFSDNSSGLIEYRLNKTGDDPAYIFRIPLDETTVSLVDTIGAAFEGEYSWTDEGGQGVRYMVLKEKEIVDVSDSLEEVTYDAHSPFVLRDLRNTLNRTDYLIVSHSDFLSAALELAQHKKKMRFVSPKIVLIEDIYNQFSGGNTDPAALRNFLAYVYTHWDGGTDFSYVTLFGSGHYDYKSVTTRTPNFIPTAYVSEKCSEDFFVSVHPDSASIHKGDYFIGRFPVKSESEGLSMVEKVIEMEDPEVAEFDSWRNRVILVADDDQQGGEFDKINRDPSISDHHESSEIVARRVEEHRPSLDIRKIYLFEYEFNEQFMKPGANEALIQEINSGVAAVNWFGHGANHMWSDEYVFTKEDVLSLYNRKRYPLISAFSCSVGKFDKPDDDCLSSLLVKQHRAGAIATVASSREVYASNNEDLAKVFYGTLFDSTSDFSIGAALNIAKSNYENSNNRPYALLGDPSIKLVDRNREVNVSLLDDKGMVRDTLKALQKVTIKGEVTHNGQTDTRFSGDDAFVRVTLYNPPDTTKRKDGGTYSDPTYVIPGASVFSVDIPVTDGAFEGAVRLPMSLSFNTPGVKLTAYAWNDTLVGTAYRKGIIFDGTVTDLVDTIGPRISIRPRYSDPAMDQAGLFVTNKVSAFLPLMCDIRISDESGLNISKTGPNEGVWLEVRGALSKR
ncbi:MAG: C25 family cysteine peptidase, partial [Chitinispirillaceae bacterium]